MKQFFPFAALLSLLCSCNVFEVDDGLVYPDRIDPLSLSQLQELNSTFHELNDGHICSTLNIYGLTGFSRILFPENGTPCENRQVVRIEMNRPDTLARAAREALLLNRDFTGVQDPSRLQVLAMEDLRGCVICEGPDIDSRAIEWKVVFEGQQVNGLPIHDTRITVVMDAHGVNRIWGNWYPEFYVPENPNYELSRAMDMLDGETLRWAGDEGEVVMYDVSREDLSSNGTRMVVPFRTDKDRLELRTGWLIHVNHDGGLSSGLRVVVDMMDGRLLLVTPRSEGVEPGLPDDTIATDETEILPR
ncbi:MAG: hypothetical protein WDZ29_00550 [Balneolaceae bacterium]